MANTIFIEPSERLFDLSTIRSEEVTITGGTAYSAGCIVDVSGGAGTISTSVPTSVSGSLGVLAADVSAEDTTAQVVIAGVAWVGGINAACGGALEATAVKEAFRANSQVVVLDAEEIQYHGEL